MKCKVCEQRLKLHKSGRTLVCGKCLATSWDYGYNITCDLCQRRVMIPDIHHKNGDYSNNSPSNRVPLCVSCHKTIHNKKRIDTMTHGYININVKKLKYYQKCLNKNK